MSKKEIGLSRRQVLLGTGTIGLASVGAGLGTTALFNDTESLDGNSVTAGKLDLAVQATVYEYQGSANSNGQSFQETVNGDTGVSQQLTDVKPGDYSYGTFCFSLDDNPGYVWAGGELVSNDENDRTEPEKEVDSTTGSGELADAIEVTLYCVDHALDTNSPPTVRPSENSSIPDHDDDDFVFQGSLRETLAALQTGIPLDNDPTMDGRQPFPAGGFSEGKCLAFAWELPLSVGNEVQTDSVEFDLAFNAVQSRNNDGSANPFADAVVTSDPSEGTDGDLAGNEQPWITASINAGPTTVVKIELNGDVYGDDSDEWPNNPNAYFMEANIDIDNDGIDEAANDDDFRVGYAAANSGARAGAISNSQTGASGNGGYIRRNTGGSSSGDSASRTDVAEEDVPGFTAYESADQLTYTFVLDWSQIEGDSTEDTAELSGVPSAIQLNEVFGGDGGEGVAATPNSSNDGRGAIDNVTGSSGTLTF